MYLVLSNEERFGKGKDFQEHVKVLLLKAGYFEGQVYSTGGTYLQDYYEQLQKHGKLSYTSPDIIILNRWDDLENGGLDKRFGIACANRNSKFDNHGSQAVTFPRYQQYRHNEIQDEIGMLMYIVFGRKIESGYKIGVTEIREPDDMRCLRDQSTGNMRWNDIFYLENLWTWKEFMEHRMKKGDNEPIEGRATAPDFASECV